MRHLLIALLIALLPVRGWVGDAMALAVQSQPAGAAAHAGCPDHAPPTWSPSAEHAQTAHAMADMAADSSAEHLTEPHGDGSHQHKTCDICNGPAMAAPAPVLPAPSTTHTQHASPALTFASSELPRSAKPPIS